MFQANEFLKILMGKPSKGLFYLNVETNDLRKINVEGECEICK